MSCGQAEQPVGGHLNFSLRHPGFQNRKNPARRLECPHLWSPPIERREPTPGMETLDSA